MSFIDSAQASDLTAAPLPPMDAGPDTMSDGVPMEMGEEAAASIEPGDDQREQDKNSERHKKLLAWIDKTNIAEDLDEETLGQIGQRVVKEYEIDETSRSDWMTQSEEAIKLAMQITEQKSYPWPNASNVVYPLMTTAAMQFAARAYPAIIAGRNVVKGVVVGKDDGEPVMAPDGSPAINLTPQGPQPVWRAPPFAKQRRADAIGSHMSYQLLEEMSEWECETDTLLHILPVVGCVFRKTYFDPSDQRNVSVMAPAQSVAINYHAKSIERAPRITEIVRFYPIEIQEMENAGCFLENEAGYGTSPDGQGDDDAPHEFLEQHRRWDLDDDGYAEPYVVTVHKATAKVVRIVARFDAEGVMVDPQGKIAKIKPVHYYTKFDFLPNPDGGIYGIGFGQLLRPINAAANTTINMLIDAGHRQVVGGGFIGRGLSMHSGAVRFKPGEYKVVNAPGAAIRDAIVDLPQPGPSVVLFQLLGMLIDAGKEIASVKDVLMGEAAAQTIQPTTLLALIEQGLKVFTAIYKRIHRALKSEYDKLYRLNRVYGERTMEYRANGEWRVITQRDYELGSGVAPISDPAMVSDMQKLARAQFLQGYQNDPACDGMEIRKRVFAAANVDDIDKLFAPPQSGPSPQLVVMQAQLVNESIKTRAAAVKDLASALLNIAKANKEAGERAMAFVDQQFEILKQDIEGLPRGEQQQQAGPQGEGNNAAGLPVLAA
jgi:chaperonin GroES